MTEDRTVLRVAQALHEHDKADPWDDAGCNDNANGLMTSCKDSYIERAKLVLAVANTDAEAKTRVHQNIVMAMRAFLSVGFQQLGTRSTDSPDGWPSLSYASALAQLNSLERLYDLSATRPYCGEVVESVGELERLISHECWLPPDHGGDIHSDGLYSWPMATNGGN